MSRSLIVSGIVGAIVGAVAVATHSTWWAIAAGVVIGLAGGVVSIALGNRRG